MSNNKVILSFLIAVSIIFFSSQDVSYAGDCPNNATAPLSSTLDLQRYLDCNGFSPGPIDGSMGPQTKQAIKTFQATNGLVSDGVVGPKTKAAMRAYTQISFTFTGSGWGHGVGLSQYGAKGLAEIGASFCSDTNSCTSSEIVKYYFTDTNVESLSSLSLSSPAIATDEDAIWVNLARNTNSVSITALPSSSPPTIEICQAGLNKTAQAQVFLSTRGYEPGPIDGSFGPKTETAIKNYQASKGLGQSGAVDDETYNQMKSDATIDGACESPLGPLKIGGGATLKFQNYRGSCSIRGHYLTPSASGSCDISIKWTDGGRLRVGSRELNHGSLKFRTTGVSSGFHIVLAINLEDYLLGLAEMPSHWNVRALEAQALVGRSYAVYQYLKTNNPSKKTELDAGLSDSTKKYCWCHIGSTASSQYYYGYLKEIAGPNWATAVNNTSGQVITHPSSTYTMSNVIQSFYSSSTGGKTNDNVVGFGSGTKWPYLNTVDDPWSIDTRVSNAQAAWSYDYSGYQLTSNILCGDSKCFDSITDIYVSSVADSGAAVEVTMKGYKNGALKTVTKSGRNIKSQLGFKSHYFKTSSASDSSNLSVGPVTIQNSSSSSTEASSSSSSGDTPIYTTSSKGLDYLSSSGVIARCDETASACQANILTREEAAAISIITSQIPLTSPNAYSDDDQSIYQSAINALPYYGMHVCIDTGIGFLPKDSLGRDEFACILVKSLQVGESNELSGRVDPYTDDGGSRWDKEMHTLAANNLMPACSSLNEKVCPSRKITVGEAAYIVNKMIEQSLISSDLYSSNNFNNSWVVTEGEVEEVVNTAVSNVGSTAGCTPKDNSNRVFNNSLDIQQFLADNGFNPGPIDGQIGEKTKSAIKDFQRQAGVTADGVVGTKTKLAMKSWTGCNTCSARDNSNADLSNITGIQTFLANNGFNPGVIDGKMGTYTKEAIKSFQREVGLIPDGVAGNRTKTTMKNYTGC